MFSKIKTVAGSLVLFKTFFILVVAKAAEVPSILHGDLPGHEPKGGANAYQDESFLIQILPNLIKWFLGFLASASIFVIMIGGYMYLTSFGGEQTDKAKKTILYAVIGLLLTILSYAIVSIVQNINFFNG